MTKKIFTLLMWLVPFMAIAQQLPVNVTGTVTDVNGAVLVNQPVIVQTDSTLANFYTNTVYTNANGQYSDAVPASNSMTGTIYISTTVSACNICYTSGALTYTIVPGAVTTVNHNFVVCAGSTSGSCNAAFTYTTQGGTLATTNQSVGSAPGTPLTCNWTLSGASSYTSTLTNPTFQNLATGVYTLCLTIADGTGCVDTQCDSMYINNGGTGGCNSTFTYTALPNTPCSYQFAAAQTSGFASLVWDFGDGSTLSGMNTMPTHAYAASGVYNVTLTMLSNNGAVCSSTTSTLVVNCTGSNTNNIGGNVSKSAPGTFIPGNATVYLIQYDSLGGGTLTAIDTTVTDSMGHYYFANVMAGNYYVKAALNAADVDYAGYLPTYFGQVLLWNQATYVTLNSNNNNISMTGGNNPGGPGFIGGLVSQGANKTAGVGDPLANLTVLLTDLNDNPISYKYTDVNGQYAFANLAYGTYKVWVDVINKTCTPLYITISATTPSVSNGNLDVNSTYIAAGIKEQAIASSFKIYPNPVQNLLTINMKEDAGKVAECKVMDMMGRIVLTKSLNPAQNTISVNEMPAGTYILWISTEKGSFTQKIVKE